MNTIAGGRHPMAKYANLPGAIPSISRPAESIKAFIMGRPNTGKTAFALSHPNGYHLNLDLTSNVSPSPTCLSWPELSPEGLPIHNGSPLTLEWDPIQSLLDTLISLAKNNQPRPQTIFIDSLSALLRYLRAWLPPNAPKVGISKEPKVNWNDLNGESAYDWLYWKVINIIESLSSSGYGVYVFAHVGDKTVPVGDRLTSAVRLTITDNFWSRLFDLFEFTGATTTKMISSQIEEVITIPRSSGPPIQKKGKKTVTRKAYFLCPYLPELGPILKSRVYLPPEIELPHENSWTTWSRIYKEGSVLGKSNPFLTTQTPVVEPSPTDPDTSDTPDTPD
jgi:hypothetical protein